MKVVHKQEDSIAGLLLQGREAESLQNWAAAEKNYHRILKRDPHHFQAFSRLMIVYRKQRFYKEELSIINKAIAVYTSLYSPKAAHSKPVRSLSAKINKAFGMVDKKGNSLYEPGPVATWKRRKVLVEKRLRK